MGDLNEQAARLMGWEQMDCCCGEKHLWTDPRERAVREPQFTTDLNDASELFRAAPEAVQINAGIELQYKATQDDERVEGLAHMLLILDPATLTRAVVAAWQEHNAKGGG